MPSPNGLCRSARLCAPVFADATARLLARNVQNILVVSRPPVQNAGHAPAIIFASMKPEPAPVPAPGQVEAPTMYKRSIGVR
jgi:hypothetical protein